MAFWIFVLLFDGCVQLLDFVNGLDSILKRSLSPLKLNLNRIKSLDFEKFTPKLRHMNSGRSLSRGLSVRVMVLGFKEILMVFNIMPVFSL